MKAAHFSLRPAMALGAHHHASTAARGFSAASEQTVLPSPETVVCVLGAARVRTDRHAQV